MMGRLKSNTKEWEKLKKRLYRFDSKAFDVGFFRGSKYNSKNNNLQVAEVAWMNDQGTSTNPPRPFLTVDFKGYAEKTFPIKAKQIFLMLMFSKDNRYLKHIKELGEEYSFALQEFILDYPGSNSLRWIEEKGFNDPLYHTGKMVESVKYRINKGTH